MAHIVEVYISMFKTFVKEEINWSFKKSQDAHIKNRQYLRYIYIYSL